jgi:hypothetical protein
VLPDRPESTETPLGQILQFRKRWRAPVSRGRSIAPDHDAAEPLDELAQYEREDHNVDYGRRMLLNVMAVGIVVLLMVAGVWIADTIVDMEKVQDCTMQGRQNCAPIAVPPPSYRP